MLHDFFRTPMWAIVWLVVCLLFPTSTGAAQPSDYFQGPARQQAYQEVERLAEIQAQWERAIINRPGVFGMGIGVNEHSGKMVFKVLVERTGSSLDLPRELEGVPVIVERGERSVALHGGSGCVPCHTSPQPLPVPMGNSGYSPSPCGACTLGFKACYRPSNTVVYVTNAHCSVDSQGCEGGAAIGSDTFHPGPLDFSCLTATDIGDVIGHVTPRCGSTNTVDGAVIGSSDTLTSRAIRDIGTPAFTTAAVLPGDTVQKSGRTTGHTFGTVDTVNHSERILDYCCGSPLFSNQIRVQANPTPFILGGDSGSALLNTANPPQVVGLLFAGNNPGSFGLANPISEVLFRLNLAMTSPCSCKAIGEFCTFDQECCSFLCSPIGQGTGLKVCN